MINRYGRGCVRFLCRAGAAIKRATFILLAMYGLFALWLLAILAVHVILNRVSFTPADDAWTIFIIASIITLSALIMLVQTRRWDAMAIGIFGLVLFDAGIYGLTSSVTIWHWRMITQGDFNWLRADLIVSGPMMFYAQTEYIIQKLATRHERHRKLKTK